MTDTENAEYTSRDDEEQYDDKDRNASSHRERDADLAWALGVLGIDSNEQDMAVIKSKYRSVISDNHPDRFEGEEVSDKKRRNALDRTQQANEAYRIICERRK